MPCFHPLQAFYSNSELTKSGKRAVMFKRFHTKERYDLGLCERASDPNFLVPCGRCQGCRLERARQTAVRCMHEASMHAENSFITLTYAPEYLPSNRSVNYSEFQLFMKRLRKRHGSGIKFFECGEYGGKERRPHFHACLFGASFLDRKLWKMSGKEKLFISDDLSDLWPFGFSTVGDVTFESAGYCARYVLKKVTGKAADEHYQFVDKANGVLHQLLPEHSHSSNKPGLGKMWYDQFSDDVYPSDEVIVNGRSCKPPRYYDKLLERVSPERFQLIKEARRKAYEERPYDGNAFRLDCKERLCELKLKRLVRLMEAV